MTAGPPKSSPSTGLLSVHVVRASRQRLEGEQVMSAYDSNAVSPHACRASRGCAHGAAPSSRAGRAGIWHTGAARALRA